MENSTAARPKRRWLLWGFIVLLLSGGVALAVVEGPLWAEFSFAADETFPNSEQWESKYIRVDIYHNFLKYSPQHLARYFYAPWERWQGIACMALRGHQNRDPAFWVGVPQLTVRTAVKTKNAGLRKLSFQAFRAVPGYKPEDVKAVLELLSAHEIPETGQFVELLAQRSGDSSQMLEATLAEWLRGNSAGRRNVAFQTAVRHFPKLDDGAVEQIRAVFSSDADDEKPWSLLHTLLDRKPEAGETLIKGSPSDQRLVWKALGARIDGQTSTGKVLEAADAAAVKELAGNAADRGALVDFLLNRPNGLNLLFRGLEARDDGYVNAVFEKLPPALFAVNRFHFERLGTKEAETFVALLPRLEGRARQRWGDWMSIAGRPVANNLFPSGAGPRNPEHAARFAKLLADDETLPWVASYYQVIAPFPKEQVGRIVSVLRKGLKDLEGPPPPPRPMMMPPVAMAPMGGGGGGARAGLSPAVIRGAYFDYAAALQQQFPNHPDVVAFFKDYPRVAEQLPGVKPSGQRASRN